MLNCIALVLLGALVGVQASYITQQQGYDLQPEPKTDQATTIVAAGDIACTPSQSTTELFCQHAMTADLVKLINPKEGARAMQKVNRKI